MADDAYLTPKEAAELLHLGRNTLAKWRMTGAGPAFVRFGKAIRYRRSDLDAWVASTLARSTSEYARKAA